MLSIALALAGKPIKTPKHSPASSTSGFNVPGQSSGSLLGGAAGANVRVGVRIGGDGSLLSPGDTSSPAGGGGYTLGGGRTLSGAPVPAFGGGGQTLGGGATAGGAAAGGAAAGSSGGGQTLGGGAAAAGSSGGEADAVKRLGLAAQTPKATDDYWAGLGGGNTMRG